MPPVRPMNLSSLRNHLRAGFCGGLDVRAVPVGFAVSTSFLDGDGDPISFYVVPEMDGFRIEDDGAYLADLMARGIGFTTGTRHQMLGGILEQAGAFWDLDSYQIRTPAFPADEMPRRIMEFTSALIRVRDMQFLTRDAVRSTFKDDALAAIESRFSAFAEIEENSAIDTRFLEFPADVVIRPREGHPAGAVYFVSSNDRLSEALLLYSEATMQGIDDLPVVGLIEDAEMSNISRKRFQRAQNRSLTLPIFRGDEDAAMNAIARRLRIGLPPRREQRALS